VADTPPALQRTDVLVLEFVADKIPYLDSVWDSIHTVIRPTIAAILGVLIANHAGSLDQALAASTSSITALLSHLTKGGLRLAVNTSPEPVTNIGTSLAEDGAVVGVALLAWQYPWAAAGIALTFLVLGMLLVYFLLSRIKRGLTRLRQRRT
jgi:O-antigen/teichoic acid export membrane protein